MFIDYYQILEIEPTHPQSEIKNAYKRQARRWHPDKNPGKDTTQEMQDVNEAYLILNDSEARKRYDLEYKLYNQFVRAERTKAGAKKDFNEEPHRSYESAQSEYQFSDETLKNWMDNARRQSAEYVQKVISDMGKLSVDATKAAGSEMAYRFIGFLIAGVIFFFLSKACGN